MLFTTKVMVVMKRVCDSRKAFGLMREARIMAQSGTVYTITVILIITTYMINSNSLNVVLDEYSGQYSFALQQYMSNVNYAAPPFDVAEHPMSNNILLCTAKHSPCLYQIVPGSNYHSGHMQPTSHRSH